MDDHPYQGQYFINEADFPIIQVPAFPIQVEETKGQEEMVFKKEIQRNILEMKQKNKMLLLQILQKDQDIEELEALIQENQVTAEFLEKKNQDFTDPKYIPRNVSDYDTFLRSQLKEQDKKLFSLELNRADVTEIQARIEKVTKEYELHIQSIVIGEYRQTIDGEIKTNRRHIEELRLQFVNLQDEIKRAEEKMQENMDLYSTLKRNLSEQIQQNCQLRQQLQNMKVKSEQQ